MMPAALLLALAVAAEPGNLCTLCHPGVRVEFSKSIHSAEDVTCVSCHGGDPTAQTVEGAHRDGFRGKIGRKEIPRICASCHSDPAKMKPYNLPTDQYALYQTSQHGLQLARGDTLVAVCTDCHGVHGILPVDDPSNAVYPLNIPKTCGRCHGDETLMGRYGLTDDSYTDYEASVHGQALLKGANASAPQCARCHGAHGATPPGVGDVDKVCGQCHTTTRAHFTDGPHKKAMDAAGLPECASCHGHHRIMKADVGMLDTVCLQCHDGASQEVELAGKMKTLFTTASDEIGKAHTAVDTAAAIPLYIEDYSARLEEGRTSLLESLPAMHSLDLGRVESLTRRARSIGAEVESEVNGKIEGRKWRRVGLLLFWFYLLLTVGILVRNRRRAAREALQ